MAIDPKSEHTAHPYRPARDRAPEGTVNTSRPESGGQTYECGDVMATPSMATTGRSPAAADSSQPRPDRAPGGAVSD